MSSKLFVEGGGPPFGFYVLSATPKLRQTIMRRGGVLVDAVSKCGIILVPSVYSSSGLKEIVAQRKNNQPILKHSWVFECDQENHLVEWTHHEVEAPETSLSSGSSPFANSRMVPETPSKLRLMGLIDRITEKVLEEDVLVSLIARDAGNLAEIMHLMFPHQSPGYFKEYAARNESHLAERVEKFRQSLRSTPILPPTPSSQRSKDSTFSLKRKRSEITPSKPSRRSSMTSMRSAHRRKTKEQVPMFIVSSDFSSRKPSLSESDSELSQVELSGAPSTSSPPHKTLFVLAERTSALRIYAEEYHEYGPSVDIKRVAQRLTAIHPEHSILSWVRYIGKKHNDLQRYALRINEPTPSPKDQEPIEIDLDDDDEEEDVKDDVDVIELLSIGDTDDEVISVDN